MMAALGAASVAAPLIGGLLQRDTSRQANNDTQAERAKLQEALDKVQNPNYDMSQFTPEEYQLVGTYAPEALPLVQERAPQLVKLSQSGQTGQDAMQSALFKLKSLGQTGADAQSQGMVEQALKASQVQNQGQQASIMDSMARRGAAPGGGLEMAAAMNAQQGNNQAANAAGTDAALQAYQTRLQSLKDSAGIGNQLSNQDMTMQSSNANIINGFNTRMANMQNQTNMYNTGNINQAQQVNLAAKQQTADQNVGLRNNAVAQKNDLYQQQYQNALDKVRIQSGVTDRNITGINQRAQDSNNSMQGMTGGISSALGFLGQGGLSKSFGDS
jgi:hypothetical protein